MSIASARAHANIALIKYWGKRDTELNLPATGSISMTLDALYTDTTVQFDPALAADDIRINGQTDAAAASRISRFLNLAREQAGETRCARVVSENNFPTGAGLASSASGFAALALAATRAAGLQQNPEQLSILARRGSGSAARSLFGGLVEMQRGNRADGSDAHARPLANDWPLEVIIAITQSAPKQTGSTQGMQASAQSSPFYAGWLAGAERDLADMRAAITAANFPALGELAEYSCLKMHALMLSTRPALIYWNPATLAAMHAVRELRETGLPVYFTIDAGPQVKALCRPEDADAVATRMADVPGVESVRHSRLGPGAHTLEEHLCE